MGQDFSTSSVRIYYIVLKAGLDMFTSLSVCMKLDVGNFGLFVCKVVRIDLELVLDLQQPSLKGGILSVSEYWWIWDLGRLGSGSRSSYRLGCGFA